MDVEEREGPRSLAWGSFLYQSAVTTTETLHGRAFGNRDGSIHTLKDGILNVFIKFQSLTDVLVEHLLHQ
jgi:hypothetical protein